MNGARWMTAMAVCGVLLLGTSGCSTARKLSGTAGKTASASLPEGLAFVKDGAALVVRDGAAAEVLPGDKQQSAVVYDAEGDALLVTENSGTSTRTVRLVKGPDVTTVLQTQDGSLFGDVRFARGTGTGFYITDGQPGSSFYTFKTASGSEATAGVRVTLPKSGATGFDLAADGTTMVYATDTAEPTQLIVMDGTAVRFAVSKLAYAFTPSFSRDGKKVCLTGIQQPGDPVRVWVLDVASQELTAVAGTERYQPSRPVFSPDATRIAFRNADDGSVWTVPAAGGTAEKLPLTVDEAALDW